MSDLIVIGFDDEFKADEVLLEMRKLEKEHLIDLEDAVVVVRDQKGKVKLKQSHNLVTAGAAGGGFWGLLIGVLFLNPLAGVLVGTAAGALGGLMKDIGIDDDFIKDLGQTIQPGTSALFILTRKVTPDKVMGEVRRLKGKVLRTSLSKEDEDKLKVAVESENSAS